MVNVLLTLQACPDWSKHMQGGPRGWSKIQREAITGRQLFSEDGRASFVIGYLKKSVSRG